MVATLVAAPEHFIDLEVVAGFIRRFPIKRYIWLEENRAIDFFYETSEMDSLAVTLKEEVKDFPYDLFIQTVDHRQKKLLIADMESTIIEQEMLDELADIIGLRHQVAAITRRAMNGELDFKEALGARVALLKGLSESVLWQVAERITMMPGATQLVATMRRMGAQCWLVSGGFTWFANPVGQRLGFNKVYANELMIHNQHILGEVLEPILDKESKKTYLEKACHILGIPLSQSLAVGDGANDIPMLRFCHEANGLGVAYHAKPNVRAVIPHQINYSDLTALLYAQGISRRDFVTSSFQT